MAPAIEAVEVPSPLRAGTGNAARFPRPRGTLPHRPAGPGTTQASARPGGREAPAEGGAGAGRGLWPPAGPDTGVALWQGRWPLPLQRGRCFRQCRRDQETRPAFPARAGRCHKDPCRPHNERPAPGPAGAKRPPGAARTLAGGFGPRRVKGQRSAVAGAMAPSISAVQALSSGWAGQGNATRVSPARAGRCPVDRQTREQQRPVPVFVKGFVLALFPASPVLRAGVCWRG